MENVTQLPEGVTITQHVVQEGEVLVEGKRIALVPETLYERQQCCPHCKSTATPEYLSELKELPSEIADMLKCSEPECGGVYLVIGHPRTYLQKPIFLNWKYNEKGEDNDGTQQQTEESEEATANPSPS